MRYSGMRLPFGACWGHLAFWNSARVLGVNLTTLSTGTLVLLFSFVDKHVSCAEMEVAYRGNHVGVVAHNKFLCILILILSVQCRGIIRCRIIAVDHIVRR